MRSSSPMVTTVKAVRLCVTSQCLWNNLIDSHVSNAVDKTLCSVIVIMFIFSLSCDSNLKYISLGAHIWAMMSHPQKKEDLIFLESQTPESLEVSLKLINTHSETLIEQCFDIENAPLKTIHSWQLDTKATDTPNNLL